MPRKIATLTTKPRKVKKVRNTSSQLQSPVVQKVDLQDSKKNKKVIGDGTRGSLKSKSQQTLFLKGAKASSVVQKKPRKAQRAMPLPRQKAKVPPDARKPNPPRRATPGRRKKSFLKISDRYPIFLFPVRLETKFMENAKELWVRVFPDDIVIETHERELTKGEVLAGRQFWSRVRAAETIARTIKRIHVRILTDRLGSSWDRAFQALPLNSPVRQALWQSYAAVKAAPKEEEKQKKAAWRELASEFGPERAVWISRQVPAYKDTNLENLREAEWTSAAKVQVFPDYFEFHLYDKNDQIIDKYTTPGKRIPDELPLMADGQESTRKDEKEALILEFFNTVQSASELMGRLSENVDSILWKAAHGVFSGIATNVINSRNRQTKSPPFQSISEIGRFWPKALLNQASQKVDGVEAFYALFIKNFESSLFDGKAQWLESFNAAVKIGMAVKIQLTEVAPPFKRIIAVGVKESLNETESVKLLEELFENHRFTEGLGFLEPGTPTNNTSTVKSGHSESTEDYDRIFDDEFGNKNELDKDKRRDPRRWGNRLEKYFGFGRASTVFSRCEHAERWEDSYQEYMNALLWGSTGEYFFTVMLGRLVPDSSTLWSNISEHVRKYVRPLGLLPTIRIGSLPYGVLPVTNTPNWTPLAESGTGGSGRVLPALLNKLLPQWLALAENSALVPRIGNSSNPESDPNQDLLQILGMEPSALSYILRSYSDYRFGTMWMFELGRRGKTIDLGLLKEWSAMLEKWWVIERKQAENLLVGLGAHDDKINETLLLRLWGWDNESEYVWENPSSFAKQQQGQNEAQTSSYEYLKAIKEGRLTAETVSKPNTLLFCLLESIGLDYVRPRAYLSKLIELDQEQSRDWIERLFVGYLDVHTHRLDAWITSLAHKRLEEMRQRNKEGIYLGAYGCLENLSPNPTASQPKTTRANKVNVEGGYIHAPSLNHASAAAVLRNAFLTYEGREQNRPFAINLTSNRIRRACRILSGIREGQPLAALLGYLIERSLHDKQLDQYINEFRTHYPFPEQNDGPSSPGQTSSTESIKPRNVLNGLKLVQGIRLGIQRGGTTKSNVLKKIGVSNIQSGDGPRLLETLSEACDAIDAMTDLLLNESIYQWVQGKFEHAGSALQAMSGQAKPPEVESIKTPVTGVSARHRVAVVFPQSQSPQTKQSDEDVLLNIRGAMEPILDHWFGALIGSTENISCRVRFEPQSGRGVGHPTAAALQMYPLDILYLSKFELSKDNVSVDEVKAEESPTEQWIRSSVRSAHELSPQARVEIDFDAIRMNGHRSFRQVFQLAQQVLKLVGQNIKLTPDRWVPPEEVDSPAVKNQWSKLLHEIKVRTQNVIQIHVDDILDKLAKPNLSKFQLMDTLMRSTRMGVLGIIPNGSPQYDQSILNHQREKAFKELTERKEKYTQLVGEADQAASDEQEIEGFHKEWQTRQEAIQALFGKNFIIFPQCWVPNSDDIQKAFVKGIYPNSLKQATATREAGSANRLWTWFHQAAQTHPRLRQLEDTLMYVDAWRASSESTETAINSNFYPRIAQLPVTEEHHWIGLSRDEIKATDQRSQGRKLDLSDEEEDFPRGALSIMAFSSEPLDLHKQPVSGVLIDDFSEVIPHADAQTGVAFQYDQPNSQPPHACLLAVPSQWEGKSGNQEAKWSREELVATVRETMNLAKIRSVDFDALGKLQNIAPGLFLPVGASLPKDPKKRKNLQLDDFIDSAQSFGRSVFLHQDIKLSSLSLNQAIVKHNFKYDSGRKIVSGIKFSKEGLEITSKLSLKTIGFQIYIRHNPPFTLPPRIPEYFTITLTLFDPSHGVFEEKEETKSIKHSSNNPEISRDYLEVTGKQPIVQVKIRRASNSQRQSSNIILQHINYFYWTTA